MGDNKDPSVVPLTCASVSCTKNAGQVCGRCSLVAYCGRDCQRMHWTLHKSDCTNSLAKEQWKPRWFQENRVPEFVGSGPPVQAYGGVEEPKYLWGNMPAIDILNLLENEGEQYEKNLDICFAASGDWRNLIKTINSLPSTFDKTLTILMNDRDEETVCRNIVMILLLAIENMDVCLDTIIHLWYSARLTPQHISVLDEYILPTIREIVNKTQDRSETALLSKIVSVANGSVNIMLYKRQWQKLLNIVEKRHSLNTSEKNRKSVVVGRRDFLDRNLFQRRRLLHRRVATVQFRTRGVLLPFGYDDAEFSEPNPTLFNEHGLWTQLDSADPLSGWSTHDVTKSATKPLPGMQNDLYGNLYFLLRCLLHNVHRKIRDRKINFEITAILAQELPNTLLTSRFDRLEVSNIIDEGYLGIWGTFNMAAKLLNRQNRHATLLALFMNAVPSMSYRNQWQVLGKCVVSASKYFGVSLPSARYDPVFLRTVNAKDLFFPVDRWFDEYSSSMGLESAIRNVGLTLSETHSIIPKWPFTLRKQFGQPGAQEEFDDLQESSLTGMERYIECRLAPEISFNTLPPIR